MTLADEVLLAVEVANFICRGCKTQEDAEYFITKHMPDFPMVGVIGLRNFYQLPHKPVVCNAETPAAGGLPPSLSLHS